MSPINAESSPSLLGQLLSFSLNLKSIKQFLFQLKS